MGLQVRRIVKGLDLARRELTLPAGNLFRPGTEGDALSLWQPEKSSRLAFC